MNITDEHLEEFIKYTVEKMRKRRPYDKGVEGDVRQFYSIFWEKEPRKVFALFKNPIPIMENNQPDRRYLRRLGKEFHLIDGKCFYKVFYQVAEILELTGDMIHVIRGSSGSSIVCYLMGITHIDPIKNDICLARFMHSLRDDMPDIDMDFPTHLRDEVYARIYRKYEGRVARISNHVHYGPKTALKQALKNNGVEGFIPKDFNYKQIIRDRLKLEDEDAIEMEAKVLEEARIYNGLEKHTSLHCGGIFIMDRPIPDDLILHEIEANGVKAYQVKLDKDETEDCGFIKIDILSNRGLSQVMDIYGELANRGIVLPSFERLPVEQHVMDSFTKNNIGITYAESRGMAKIFKRLAPKTIDDLSTALALIRPAASENGQKGEYLRALHRQPENPLEPEKRHWVIYDDDAITYIGRLLNIGEDEADIYRKAFSKTGEKAIAKQKEFCARLIRTNRYRREQIDEIITQLKSLQEYGFCKSHSYSYAYLIYALAYLKYYYPREFWKATLNHCHSSYHRWVHYREASCHLKLTHMAKPYKISTDGDRLIPMSGRIQPRLFSNQREDFLKMKYWIDERFLEGMYYFITNRHEGEKQIVRFRGLVATYRPYKYQGRKITFITVGYDNSSYIDIIAYGHYPLSKWLAIEGEGLIDEDYISCKSVKPVII